MKTPKETKQLLFLSADMTNSTVLKNESPKWEEIILRFRNRFKCYLDVITFAAKGSNRLILWKTIGDELVFTVELKNESEVIKYLIIFREAIYKYNDTIRFNSKSSFAEATLCGDRLMTKGIIEKYPIKGTAWLASFPEGNIEIVDNNYKPPVYDYIGPDVDLGFRLSKRASKRKLIISAELSALLLKQENIDMLFYYDGKEVLKGINKNKPYPIIWIDVFEIEKTLCQGLDESERPKREIDPDDLSICDNMKLREYIDNFIRNNQ